MDHQSTEIIGVMDGSLRGQEASGSELLTGGLRGHACRGESLGARIARLAEIASVLHLGGEYLQGGSGGAGWSEAGVSGESCEKGKLG